MPPMRKLRGNITTRSLIAGLAVLANTIPVQLTLQWVGGCWLIMEYDALAK
jgi:hypothetical protein